MVSLWLCCSSCKCLHDLSDDEQLSSDSVSLEQPPKKAFPAQLTTEQSRSTELNRATAKVQEWEKDFPWLEYDENYHGAFCKICHKRAQHSSQKSGGAWIMKPFKNWKKNSGVDSWVMLTFNILKLKC